MHKVLRSIKNTLSLMTIKNIIIIFTINSVFALIRTIYQMTVVESSLEVFYVELFGYVKVMNIFGFSLAYTYLFLSRGPEAKMPMIRIIMIGLLAFAISLPFIYFMFVWDESSLPPVLQAIIYSFSTLLFSAWAIIVIIYVQSRESQPKFQLLKQQVQEQSEVRERAEMELHLLQAQIEPHFFYNTLANLHSLIDLDPERAKALLEELTEYLRSTVPLFKEKYVTLEEEKEMIRRYLNIQTIRFSDKFDFEINIPKEHNKYPILPMSLLTLVENAIKHGIEKTSGKGKIIINSELTNKNTLLTSVIDSAGLYNKNIHGTGLSNLNARMKVTYGETATFSIDLSSHSGTIAQLEVPING